MINLGQNPLSDYLWDFFSNEKSTAIQHTPNVTGYNCMETNASRHVL